MAAWPRSAARRAGRCTLLVGKLPKAARQDCWPLVAWPSCKGYEKAN
jgi:hypothetical protein